MTKTQPTHKKLPRAKVMFGYPAQYAEGSCYVCNSKRKYAAQDLTFAVLPCHTAAQAKAICRAAPFLQMTEGEKEQVLTMALIDSWAGGSFHDVARACLRAMGLGGGK